MYTEIILWGERLSASEDSADTIQAFLEHEGYRRGYWTPGQILSAVSALKEVAAGLPSHVTADLTAPIARSDAELRERMSGNLCRCSAYPNMIAAIRAVAAGGR